MTTISLPEVTASAAVAEVVRQACDSADALTELEGEARGTGKLPAAFAASEAWRSFAESVLAVWSARDHVIIRGLPAMSDGASLLLAALALGGRFKTYRGGKIVKTFRMSPWTKDLSHTLREGEFHTDLNTDSEPPAVTGIQCLDPDPGAPGYGINRVVRTVDLLSYQDPNGTNQLQRFLCETRVTMVNDRSDAAWSGTIIEGERIRFHPETLRTASQRLQQDDSEMEARLLAVHRAALAVSVPFWLDAGDVLLVSNHRALHYRGECSVVFTNFPLEFLSRSIHVLHKLDEPR